MAKIEAKAIKRWNLKKFAAIHRIGNLKIGEVSVAIPYPLSIELKHLKQQDMLSTKLNQKFQSGRK
jgi:MoaE protein